MNDCQKFENVMKEHGLEKFLVDGFIKAAASEQSDVIIYVPDDENNFFDIYLVGKKDGVFTEYVCWVSDEFEEDETLLETVLACIVNSYDQEKSVRECLHEMNPYLHFSDYTPDEHVEIYAALK